MLPEVLLDYWKEVRPPISDSMGFCSVTKTSGLSLEAGCYHRYYLELKHFERPLVGLLLSFRSLG